MPKHSPPKTKKGAQQIQTRGSAAAAQSAKQSSPAASAADAAPTFSQENLETPVAIAARLDKLEANQQRVEGLLSQLSSALQASGLIAHDVAAAETSPREKSAAPKNRRPRRRSPPPFSNSLSY